jgi:hypothetical protein
VADASAPRDALTLLVLLARSRRLVLPLLAATAVATVLVVGSVPVSYEATGKIIVEPTAAAATRPGADGLGAQNPFAQFNPSFAIVGDIIAQVVGGDAERDALQDAGASRSYTVESSDVWSAPVLLIQAASRDQEEATRTVLLVAQAIQDELVVQQTAAGAAPETFLTVRTLVAPAAPRPLYGGRVRSGLACLLLGLGGTIALTVYLDARRRAAGSMRLRAHAETSDRRLLGNRPTAEAHT